MNVILESEVVAAPYSLLEEDQAFKLTPVGESSYDAGKVALTWRWPRMKDGQVTTVISTTVVNASNLHKIRVEEIDGQYFLINEPTRDYEQEIRLCIQDQLVGSEIIRSLIGLIASKPVDLDNEAESLGIPAKLARVNKMAEHLLPIAAFTFLVATSLAALYFIL